MAEGWVTKFSPPGADGGVDILAGRGSLGLEAPRLCVQVKSQPSPADVTIYRTPLGGIIARLVTTMRPHGFHLTAPVFEHMDRPELLAEEVSEDMLHGLIGKTAIHPDQVPLIESHYRVCPNDVEAAQMILQENCPAVFGHGGSMCEVSTHTSWAKNILTRMQAFGSVVSQGS